MRSLSGLITGVVLLSLLQVVVSDEGAAGRVGLLLTGPAAILKHWTAIDLPLIPDRRQPR